jgi:hypothetical protein
MKTEAEYVEEQGLGCLYCDSADIAPGHAEVDTNNVYVDVRCDQCGAEWQDVYQLVGYCVR